MSFIAVGVGAAGTAATIASQQAGKGKGGGSAVNTSGATSMKQEPWFEQGPYLTQGFAQAGNLLNNTKPSYYPGSTVSPFSSAQSQGYQQIIDQASRGSPLTPAMQQTALKTIQGGFLDPSSNPWLSKTFGAAADDVTRAYQTATAPTTAANFSGAGRYGSPGYRLAVEGNERTLGSTLNNLGTQIYGGNYQLERDRQQGAVNNTGNYIQTSYLEPTAMVNAGIAQQAQSQRELTDQVNRWNVEQNPAALWDQLAKYMSIVGSANWGGSSQGTNFGGQTQQRPDGTLPTALGGALSAASLAGQLGWDPFGGGAGSYIPSTGGSLGMPNVRI